MAKCESGARLLAASIALGITAAAAGEIPTELRGRSIILGWNESRTSRPLGEAQNGRTYVTAMNFDLRVYVSVKGRIFSNFNRTSGNRAESTTNDISQHDEPIRNEESLHWRFDGASLIADMSFTQGVRRLAIKFGDDFGSCSIDVTYAREGGTKPFIITDRMTGKQSERISSTINSSNCAIREGNVLAENKSGSD